MATTVRRKNINSLSSQHLDSWARENTSGIFKTESMEKADFETIDIFGLVIIRKKLIAVLDAKGLDVFKRGTKEPERIKQALKSITLEEVERTEESQRARSPIFD